VEVPLQHADWNRTEVSTYRVSILVLMEVPLQPGTGNIFSASSLFRFNPCFNGSSSSTEGDHRAKLSLALFQSLF